MDDSRHPHHVDRTADLARLGLAIGSGRGDGVRIAILSGPAGSGRTTLLADLGASAAERGFSVVDDIQAAARLLDAATRPVLLLLDDADQRPATELDAALRLLGPEDRDVALLLVEHEHASAEPWSSARARLTSSAIVQHVTVGAMGRRQGEELVRALRPGLADEEVASIVAEAGGLAGHLVALATAPRGEVPRTLMTQVARRMSALDAANADVLQVLALSDIAVPWSTITTLERLHGAPDASATLAETGFLRHAGTASEVWPPVVRRAITRQQSAAVRRTAHGELADALLATTVRGHELDVAIAEHRAAAGRIEESVSLLALLAMRQEAAGAIEDAVTLLRRALTRARGSDERMLLARRAAETAHQARRSDLAAELWQSMYVSSERLGDDERSAYALVQWFWAGEDLADRSRLERAAQVDPNGGWSTYARAVIASLDGDLDEAARCASRALDLANAMHDEQLRSVVGEKLAYWLADSGRDHDAISPLRVSMAASRELGLAYSTVSAWSNLTQMLVEDLCTTEALDESRALLAHAHREAREPLMALAQGMHARCLAAAGDLAGAARAAGEAVRTAGPGHDETALLAAAIHADVLLTIGDAPRARRAVRTLRDAAERSGHEFFAFEVGFAQARLDALTGGPELAAAWAARASTSFLPALADAALWAARTGVEMDEPRLLDGARRLGLLGAGATSSLARLALAEVDVRLAAPIESATLERLAERWDEAHRPLDAGRCRVAAAIPCAETEPDHARELLSRAIASLRAGGALADADAAAARARRLGSLAPATRSASGIRGLSTRELQVARLVASGLSNDDVAERAGLSTNTVRTHLRNVYRKLGVRSRGDLAANWRDTLEG